MSPHSRRRPADESPATVPLPLGSLTGAGGWLISEMLERPFPVHRGVPVTLGRGAENHIVLPAQQVSRRHATIEWTEQGFEVADLGSMNGIRVNGEVARRRRLRDGDALRIGPVELIFTTRSLEHGGSGDGNETSHDWGPVVSRTSLAGVLAHLSVQDVWQMLELGQKTGRLVVQQGELRGEIYFSGGRAVHAEIGELSGDRAAIAILLLDAGTFRFQPLSELDVEPTIQRAPTSILLEAARLMDEGGREVA